MLYKKLENDELYLAPIDAQNVELCTKWLNDETLTRGLGQTINIYTELSERNYMEEQSKKLNNYQFYVVRKSDDKILGIYDLHNVLQVHQYAEVGGFIGDPEDRNKGYGNKALTMICDFGFNVLNLKNLVGRIFSFNYASIKSAEKVGFKKVGLIKDRYYYLGKFHDEVILQLSKEEFYKNHHTTLKPLPQEIK